MTGRDYTVVVLAVAVLLGAVWIAGGGDTVSAQSGAVRDCHFTLFADGHQATNVRRPDVFLLDECTGDTWLFFRDDLGWFQLDQLVPRQR